MSYKNKNTSGFSLIEIAISMIVIGVLIGAVIYPYSIWVKQERHNRTADHVERMSFAVGAFRSANGRYPCPAPIDAARTDTDYGTPTDCTDESIAVGSCSGGICITQSRRTYNTPADILSGDFVDINSNNSQDAWELGPGGLGYTPRVRIGAIPFRALNIPESFTYDAYGNRIMYAVTEVLAADYTYNVDAGGISIEYTNDAGARESRIPTPHSAHFVVLSHGSNGMGAYTRQGITGSFPCTGTIQDVENCEYSMGTPDPTFYIDDYTTRIDIEHDDIALHQMPLNAPLWAKSPDNPSSIYAILSSSANGNVGGDWIYNFYTNINPDYFGASTRLWINGNMLIDQVGSVGGDALGTQFCRTDGTACFPAQMIGGTGVDCISEGGLMYGVANADASCTSTNLNIMCPSGQILRGLNSGLLVCDYRPCAGTNFTSCSQTISVPDSMHNSSYTYYTGDSECNTTTYTCNNGTWDVFSSGQCSCVPSTTTSSLSCGSGCTGSIDYENEQICDFRNCYTTSTLIGQDCTCPPPPPPPGCDPLVECCTGSEPSCAPGCDPTIQCCNGSGVGCPPACDPAIECCNGYSNFPTCGPPPCDPLIECCNGYSNFPTCGPPPPCDPVVECCNGYSNFPICGPVGSGGGPGDPPCLGGANPPPCHGP